MNLYLCVYNWQNIKHIHKELQKKEHRKKNLKNWDTQKIAVIILKFEQCGSTIE